MPAADKINLNENTSCALLCAKCKRLAKVHPVLGVHICEVTEDEFKSFVDESLKIPFVKLTA